GLLCLIVAVAIYKATERAHFEKRLQQTLWELRQSGDSPEVLQTEARLKLLRQLRSRYAEKRWGAAKVIASWRDCASVPALIGAMQDDKGTQRTCQMAQALGQIGDPTAVPALAQALYHPNNVDLRVCATHALAEIGETDALAALLEKVTPPNRSGGDYEIAILAIGEIGLPQALPTLRTIAEQNASPRIRELAESAIKQIELLGGEDVMTKLLAALEDNSDWIQDSWIFKQLHKHWDDHVAVALNDYLASYKNGRTDNLIQATALLIHHHGLMPSTMAVLAQSPKRQKQWLAQICMKTEGEG
ncbi:MAG: HEAT repeat domain-containing protein, partial [Candidatus Poribacteria bacterium]|nr:HEAT repeat domain-containing protein [Candidatus Poribacteria bacterium]